MNIYDLAREAGVSIATASKALNGRKDVNERTRQRVMDVAKKLNYHPSHMARGLARKRSENIGVIALRRFHSAMFTNPFYSHVLEGMELELTERNYNLVLGVLPSEDGGARVQVPKMIREKNVDGLVLLGETLPALLREVQERRIPAVLVDSQVAGMEAHSVLTDNRQGAGLAAQRLAALGHRRAALLTQDTPDASFAERRQGFVDGCREQGIKLEQTLEAPEDATRCAALLAAFLASPKRPTAVFCCNDFFALRLLEAARLAGVQVPAQLSVIGFDDIAAAEIAKPPLSTLRVDKVNMGKRAVQKVLEQLDNPSPPSRELLPVTLIERASLGQAPKD